MDKNRKTSHILNIFQYDADGHVVLPASLTLSIAPGASDNNSKVPTTAWVRTYVSGLTYATQSYVNTQVANLVASSPATLDTLNELAAALGNDPNFATSVATSIGTKQAQLNGTGFVKVTGTTVSYDNSTYLTSASLTSYVPYTGATGAVNLGNYNLTIKEIVIGTGAKNNTNIAIGRNVMSYSSGGTGNVAIGVDALYFDQSDGSVVIGYEAGYYSNQGRNVTIGYQAGRGNGPGSNSIAVGYQALMNNTNGTKNIALGYLAGSELVGSNNTIIGGYLGTTMSSNVVIADGAGNIRFQWDGSNIKLNGNTVGSNAYTSTAYLPLAGGTLTGSLVVPSPFTIKDTNPYIQWQNSSGTRLGYIQHATNLVMSADTGSVILTTASGTLTLTSVGNFDHGGYNIQSSNNAIYRQAFWGAMSIMWRNAEDFYIDSNHTYSSSNTNVASYTSSNGIGRIGIAGGDFSWSTYNGAVNAGSAYGLTERFNIAPSGVARFSSSVQATDFRYTNTGYITYDTANTGSESLIIRKFGTPVLTLDSISRATFASTVFIGGNLHFDTNGTVRTISNYGYGGSLQLLRSDSTSTRWARIGMVDATGTNFIGGMTINNDTSATFSSNITTTGTIIINSRTVYTTAAIYDNGSAGNNVGIGFGPNSILPITGDGTTSNGTKNLGSSSVRWSTVYTSDLSLSNGIGDYTIVEGENDLFLYNNKQNKVYKFMLAEVDPADATPKKS